MRRRTLGLILTNAALGLSLVVGNGQAAAAPDAQQAALVTTITYDDSAAAEFKTAVADGIKIWNESVTNVRIVKAAPGTTANVRVIADNNWPRATLGPIRQGGRGTVWMGRQATQQGHNAIRIAAHEFGHILGLPDRRTGVCADLMSGSSAPATCTNARPNTAEKSQVQRNYSGTSSFAPRSAQVIIEDAA